MKKLTLSILFIIPLLTFSQVYNFNSSADGWVKNVSFGLLTENADFITLTTLENTGNDTTIKDPFIQNTSANVNTATYKAVAITLRNNQAAGPATLRFSYAKASGGRRTLALAIPKGHLDFKTYWINLEHADWTGTINDIRLQFSSETGTNYVVPNPQVTIDIDKVEFTATLPTSMSKETFNFATDNDSEGFGPTSGGDILVEGPTNGNGVLTVTPIQSPKFPKFEQFLHHVDASNNKYIHFTLKNNSALNDLLYIIVVGKIGASDPMTMSTEDAAESTYTMDLSGFGNWSASNERFFIRVGSSTDLNTDSSIKGRNLDLGSIEISSIVINDSPTFSSESFDAASFTMSPNPAQNSVKIHTLNTISKVLIYNIAGSKVLESNGNQKSIDVSPLNSGIYFVKISDRNNNLSTQKLIIQ